MKGIKIMRELNEQELEQVAGGSGFTFTYLAQEQAGGGALTAGDGIAYSQSFVSSTHGLTTTSSTAANKSFATGPYASVQSVAASASSVIITGH